jgi:hypothetical protein
MKTVFKEFIMLLESTDVHISLSDLDKVIKKIFNESKIQSIKTTFEKDGNDRLKFVIAINNLFFNKSNILHTKFMFYTDLEKTKILGNSFKYLFDINCIYREVQFNDAIDMETKINDIINNKKFGNNIKDISNIYVTLSSSINEMIRKKKIENVTVYNVEYAPLVDIVPCDSFSFNFNINVNNTSELKMNIQKINNNEYKYSFTDKDWHEDITKSDIKGTVDIITDVIKNYLT